jgi:hypothetical protein
MRVVFLAEVPARDAPVHARPREVGAQVLGVGDGSPDPELRRYLSGYLEVPSLLDERI